MQAKFLQACALALCLAGCVTVPTLYGSPEEIAGRIGDHAVAYNQAYGRAIANQVVLNTLRARDRLPLYHLSMSGIGDSSYTDVTGEAQLGSIGLGQGNANWGIAQVTGSRANRTSPTYTLNPFGGSGDNQGRALQFSLMNQERFVRYWNADWPRETLLYVMVDSITEVTRQRRFVYSNSPASMRGCPHGATPPCTFVDVVRSISSNADNVSFEACVAADTAGGDNCGTRIVVGRKRYVLEFRALDDMIYYLGSTLREGAPRPAVRPPGVYPTDPNDENSWDLIQRSAPLFTVSRAPAEFDATAYAAVVQYRGERYVAGPANSGHCVISADQTCEAVSRAGDATANVLSLLTQLVVLSQSEEAQMAPQRAVVQAQ